MSFIVIEGLDGSGKSTQIRRLRAYFDQHRLPYYFLHFPRTDTGLFGNLISRFLRGEMGKNQHVDPYLVALLYAGDRRDAAGDIRKAIAENKLVLVDRYVYSNIAFQCAKCESKEEQLALQQWILDLEYHHYNIPKPDLNLFLDVPFSFTREKLSGKRRGSERQYLNGSADIHEKDIVFQHRVAEVYRHLVETDEITAITCYDAAEKILPEEKVFELILKALQENITELDRLV